MSELLALGVSHKTAPLELRERLALTEGRAAGVLERAARRRADPRGRGALDLQPHRALPRRRRPGRGRVGGARRARARGRHPPDRAARPPLLAARRRGRPPPLPRHRRPRLDDPRRGRDPGPGQARLRAGAGRGRHRARSSTASSAARSRPASGPATETADRREGASRSPRSPSSWRSARSATSPSAACCVIGAGETAELTARALAARGVETVFIANRRYDRAIGLAQRFGGEAVRIDELPAQLASAPTSSSPRPTRRTT